MCTLSPAGDVIPTPTSERGRKLSKETISVDVELIQMHKEEEAGSRSLHLLRSLPHMRVELLQSKARWPDGLRVAC